MGVKFICSVLLVIGYVHYLVFAQPCQTPWKDCGSTGIKINNVVVPGCCSSPCQLHKGKNASLSVFFTPGSNYSDVTQKLCAILGPVCVKPPFKFPPDVCTLVTDCPFVSGKQYNDTVIIYVDPSFPNVTTIAKWTFYDPDDKMIGCFEIPLQLTG